ncbi:MAG: NADPH-dependent FMN reductase [Chitinophagaceae bacterium]
MNIEIISSSPRNTSLTNRVALHLQKHFSLTTEHNIGLIDVREFKLGMLENVFSSIENTPEEYKPLAKRIFAADAFILVTPEYNGSYSPALQNLLDHFPKQSRKPFGLVTASTGAMGGMRATQQLLLLVPALFGIASPHMLVVPAVDKKFDVEGNLLDENYQKNIDNFSKEFLWLAEKVNDN